MAVEETRFYEPAARFHATPLGWIDLNGKTILLHAEQGFGDAIQFVRYARLVRERGGRYLLECHKELYSLFRSLPDVSEIFVMGDRLPHFDVHCPLMSLPLCFGTTVENIPAPVPYLGVEAARERAWSTRIKRVAGELRVGIAWTGNPIHQNDTRRSLPPPLLRLFTIFPGCVSSVLVRSMEKEERGSC